MVEIILKKEIIVNKALCRTLGVAAFIILTSLAAFVRIPLPFTPVPITLQTFFVLLSGAFLGSNLGAVSQLGYILLGICGLPVFTGAGSGLFYIFGPTGGYLFGFILASFFIGRFIPHQDAGAGFIKSAKNDLVFTFGLFCLADLVLLLSGALWLKFLFGYNLPRSLSIGLLPFIPGDLLKIAVAVGFYTKLKSRVKEIF